MDDPLKTLPPNVQKTLRWILDELGVDADRHLECGRHHVAPRTLELPEGAESQLRPDHPRLVELRHRYHGHSAAEHALWTPEFVSRMVDIRAFRADNAYVWQQRDLMTDIRYVLTTYYVREHDSMNLLRRLEEDALFGAYCVRVDDQVTVSRDLLDSITEIGFLCEALDIQDASELNVLDIGAGYGRLAHRLATALPKAREILCVDAVPESTFVSEYYLGFRGVQERARTIPLTDIENALAERQIHLATNIHSFSECSLSCVEWWLDLLEKHDIRYLMLVPSASYCAGERLLSFDKRDYYPALRRHGYRLKELRPKYYHAPSVQQYGLYPTFYYLFERDG